MAAPMTAPMTEYSIPPPTEIKYHKRSRELTVRFDDGMTGRLSAEYLRVHSPSAEVKGHAAGEGVLVTGKEKVGIARIEPVGRYAVKLVFDDGHDTGLYSWDYLHELGRDHGKRWALYREAVKG